MKKYAKMFAPVFILLVWAWILNWVDIGIINSTAAPGAVWVAGAGISFLVGVAFAVSFYVFVQTVDSPKRA